MRGTSGDGKTGEGVSPNHTYDSSGTRTVTLTVVSSKGKSATISHQVEVTRQNKAPIADFTVHCNQLTCEVDGSKSSDPDGTVDSYNWTFDNGGEQSGVQATHEFATPGTHTVSLTVTDNEGAQSTKSQEVQTTDATVSFVGANSTNGNRANHSVTVPSGVQEGDTLVLAFAMNSSTATITAPSGWTELKSGSIDGMQSRLWTKTASPTDAGTSVAVATSATSKSDVTVAAYRVDGGAASVTASDLAMKSSSISELTTPTVEVVEPGSWVVSYWGAKSSSATAFETPQSQVQRSASQGSGSGAVSAVLTDGNRSESIGQQGGNKATLSSPASRGAAATVVISPTN